MTQWIREWFVQSVLVFLSICMAVVLWTIWPLLSVRLSSPPTPSPLALDAEAISALLLLLVVGVGYVKLLRGK